MTHVTFRIEDAIKGAPGKSYTIHMLGGTVDGETMEVADAPRFKVGDRDILFVEHNGTQFIPLVGIMHGRFHVQTDAGGRDVVAKDNGAFLADVAKLGQDEKAAITGPALSAADFKSAIRQKLSPARKVGSARCADRSARTRYFRVPSSLLVVPPPDRSPSRSCRVRAWPNYVR